MLRISATESARNATTLRLEGQIAGPWAEELSATCGRLLDANHRLTLDLGDVTLIDRPALAYLASLPGHSVTFARCSPFHQEQLKQAELPGRPSTTHAQ